MTTPLKSGDVKVAMQKLDENIHPFGNKQQSCRSDMINQHQGGRNIFFVGCKTIAGHKPHSTILQQQREGSERKQEKDLWKTTKIFGDINLPCPQSFSWSAGLNIAGLVEAALKA